MAGRALAFSDPTVIALASERFVPVAENCSPLQRQADAEGDFFRLVAEQGHYAGRVFPTGTRQGYYAFTADGRVLAAGNSRDAGRMIELMETALRRWGALADGGRDAAGGAPEPFDPATPDRYPADGLVLRLVARDLPREADTRKEDWRKGAWNLDYAWITRDEAAGMVPASLTLGARREAPREVVRRLGRFHLRDFVRGEPGVWPEEAIREGRLVAEVIGVTPGTSGKGARARLRLEGAIRLEHTARWVRPEDGTARESPCGFDATLTGEAEWEWDAGEGRFVAFELLAAGARRGANQYNNRGDDEGPAPLGIAFELAGSAPRDRTPPHTIYHREYFGVIGAERGAPAGGAAMSGRTQGKSGGHERGSRDE